MPDNKIVFDATVLSNFLIADAASILIERYSKRGILTWQVYDELSAGFRKEPSLQAIELLLSKKEFLLVTLSQKEHALYISLLDSLGKGESSCIVNAKYSGHMIATDDKVARRQCEAVKIKCTSTIGILMAAYYEKQIDITRADAILSSMIKGGFYSPVRKISDMI